MTAQGRARVLALSPKLVSQEQKITESASTRASPSAFGSGWCRAQGHSQEDEEKQKDKAETRTCLECIGE